MRLSYYSRPITVSFQGAVNVAAMRDMEKRERGL